MKIEIENLVKYYGKKRAIDNINLEINDGVYGLLGKNGAGKTTLMKIIVTLAKRTSGTIKINGVSIDDKKKVRQMIGYLPQEFSVYPMFTTYDIMDYFAALSEIKGDKKKLIYSLLEQVNLEECAKVKVSKLSGGMKRRLAIAMALLNNPLLLVVDEPTAGLDPEERIRIRNMLGEFSKDRTVLLSTHIVSDLESFCDKLAVMDHGRIIFQGRVEDLKNQAVNNIWEIEGPKDVMSEILKQISASCILSNIVCDDKIIIKMLSNKKPFENAISLKPSLEDAYMNLVKEMAV